MKWKKKSWNAPVYVVTIKRDLIYTATCTVLAFVSMWIWHNAFFAILLFGMATTMFVLPIIMRPVKDNE